MAIAEAGRRLGCKEALFTLGDRPEERYEVAREWLEERGYASTLDYVRAVAIRVIEETGLLPHLNPGVMSLRGARPAQAGRAVDGPDARDVVDRGCPSAAGRTSARRTRSPRCACGRSRTPDGSRSRSRPGILVGIGETLARARRVAARDPRRPSAVPPRPGGHRPELPREARDRDARRRRSPPTEEFLAAVATARVVLGPRMHVQAPPNLSDPSEQRAAARRRDRRLGRRLAPHARPREPRAALAGARASSPPGRPNAASSSASGSRSIPEFALPARPVPRRQDAGAGRPRSWDRTAWPSPGRSPEPIAVAGPRGRSGSRGRSSSRSRRARARASERTPRPSTARLRGPGGHARLGTRTGSPPNGSTPTGQVGAARRPSAHEPITDDEALALFRAEGAGPRGAVRGRGRPAPRGRRRRGHLRRQPQHQLHERVLRRVPVLRVRPARGRRRVLHAHAGRGRRSRARGGRVGRDRGVHAGRDPSRSAGHASTSTCSTP